MRTSSVLLFVAILSGGAGPALALDPDLTPADAFRSGYQAYKAGDRDTAIEALNFAAQKGHPGAMWKLGRMYATGDLVKEDDGKAIELFSKVADEYADGNPRGPNAPFVSDAFVTLGGYYQRGIPGTVTADPDRARRYFSYAASYFGDPQAQYSLAGMYQAGQGGNRDQRQAARWYKLAAEKGHTGAQAQLGRMMLEGAGVQKNPVKGLMWLTIAQLGSRGDPAIQALHEEAFSAAEEAQRRAAIALAEDWIDRRRPK
jgi:TPR repeat protein